MAFVFYFFNLAFPLSVTNLVLMFISDVRASFYGLISHLSLADSNFSSTMMWLVWLVCIFWLLLHIWLSRRTYQCGCQFKTGLFWWGFIFFFQIMSILWTFFFELFFVEFIVIGWCIKLRFVIAKMEFVNFVKIICLYLSNNFWWFIQR